MGLPEHTRGGESVPADADLVARGTATLLAAWEEYARGAAGAAVHRLPGVAAAVFPLGPEREVYNNAVLAGDLVPTERAAAVDVMEEAYASAGVARFAAWVHEDDPAMRADLERRGYSLDETTRAMGMALDEFPVPRVALDLAPPDWAEYLRVIDVAPELLAGADHGAFHVVVARHGGEAVSAAMAYDHGDDCGIYNVGTRTHARRRGLGTAVTAELVRAARGRACRTASLQATPMAEHLYAALGFRDLGRILEFVPAGSGR
jgi:ribosomal protein S18 acetylase RimI-like enzyme